MKIKAVSPKDLQGISTYLFKIESRDSSSDEVESKMTWLNLSSFKAEFLGWVSHQRYVCALYRR